MENNKSYIIKTFLGSINNSLSNSSMFQISIASAFHNWQSHFTFSKNTLLLTNRIINHCNQYHIFRTQIFIGLVGIGVGILVGQVENHYGLMLNKTKDYKVVKEALITNVLQGQKVRNLLIQVLRPNIMLNPSIQFQMHEAILNLGIKPQQQPLIELVNRLILSSLKLPQLDDLVKDKAFKHLIELNDPIMNFLRGEVFQEIVTNGLASVLRSQTVQGIIKDGMVEGVRWNLSNEKNMQDVYAGIKSKMFWL